MTVAKMTAKGRVRLNDAQLKALMVGKAIGVRNTVTGEQFTLQFEIDGQYLVQPATAAKAKQTSEFGDLMSNAQHEAALEYSIQNDKILTKVGETVFRFVVYKQGERYVAARETEFGYANYEIIPAEIKRVETAKGSPLTDPTCTPSGMTLLAQGADSLICGTRKRSLATDRGGSMSRRRERGAGTILGQLDRDIA